LDAIDFVGRVSDVELQQLFATAAVLVNPSSREGFGLVIAEAASAGTPSVVVDGPDNAAVELVEVGVNGAVAESASPTDLAVAIESVILAGEELRRTTLNWYVSASETHNLGASVDELLRRYELAARSKD
jgi:glycosyltransferase involved in cell wall biosynthesis